MGNGRCGCEASGGGDNGDLGVRAMDSGWRVEGGWWMDLAEVEAERSEHTQTMCLQ